MAEAVPAKLTPAATTVHAHNTDSNGDDHLPNIDSIGDDLLQNIVRRLPAKSIASAACVNRSLNAACESVLRRPKLSSAYSVKHCLQDAVDEVVSIVLSEPIRPQFAIVSMGGDFDIDPRKSYNLEVAHKLVIAALGPRVPVISNCPRGIIARDALTDQFKQIEFSDEDYEGDAIMLTVGFLPGLKVEAISLSMRTEKPQTPMIEKFIADIRDFSTSVSGSNSPVAMIMFCSHDICMKDFVEKMDYAMSPETVIVGDQLSDFRCTPIHGYFPASALVFDVERKKPHALETRFHAVLSSGLSPVGPTYKAASVSVKSGLLSIAATKDGSHEKINAATILNNVYDELGHRSHNLYIGVTKERQYSIGQESPGFMTSRSFYLLDKNMISSEYIFAYGEGVKTGDTFCFYYEDSTAALSSLAAVSDHLRSFSSEREVFGGLVFSCGEESSSSDPSVCLHQTAFG